MECLLKITISMATRFYLVCDSPDSFSSRTVSEQGATTGNAGGQKYIHVILLHVCQSVWEAFDCLEGAEAV